MQWWGVTFTGVLITALATLTIMTGLLAVYNEGRRRRVKRDKVEKE